MYIADLHIHSRYSRATSKDGCPEVLGLWAAKKGIRLIGTGDFTHPAWREELEEKLEPAENGFYCLKEKLSRTGSASWQRMEPRFVVSGEISSIYKKDGKVRKVHNLILLPSLRDAKLLSGRLEEIGNLRSDGRPILGLDCRDLLEITMEVCPKAVFIPAHIWTPHFSMLGALSGFDSPEECFGDMAGYIHAVETGLSSDPPMNWRLSMLDKYQLVSNSDAHSPAKLGREANLLTGEFSYEGLYRAVQTGEGLEGTIEFFPEEGKYHFDGHRKCGICLSPLEAEARQGICPVCQRRLTMGVSHRVEQLADRKEGFLPARAKPYESLVPLPEVLAASMGLGTGSRRVEQLYEEMLAGLGSEFEILREVPVEEIQRKAGYLAAEGIRRLRNRQVKRIPGFDGEYGRIRLFTSDEIRNTEGQLSLFDGWMEQAAPDRETAAVSEAERAPQPGSIPRRKGAVSGSVSHPESGSGAVGAEDASGTTEAKAKGGVAGSEASEPVPSKPAWNAAQLQAARTPGRVIAVQAGPGTGKTASLIARVHWLLEGRRISPASVTVVTFTRKAAAEVRERLERELGKRRGRGLTAGTFHSICLELLEKTGRKPALADDGVMRETAREAVKTAGLSMSAGDFLLRLTRYKAKGSEDALEGNFRKAADFYQKRLEERGFWDYDDLILETSRLIESGEISEELLAPFTYLLVDEFQDINPAQYRLIRNWNRGGRELFVIGDPDQAIYSFRGADADCFGRLSREWPDLTFIRLTENYRCMPKILKGAGAVIEKNPGGSRTLRANRQGESPIRLVLSTGETAAAMYAAKEISRQVGGLDMLASHEKGNRLEDREARSFGDLAVLYRTRRQGELLEKVFAQEGIPCVVAGREDYLDMPSVRGAVSFFNRALGKAEVPYGVLARQLLEKDGDSPMAAMIFDQKLEKYGAMAARTRPAKVLEAWAAEFGLDKDEGIRKLENMALLHDRMQELLDTIVLGAEGDLRRAGTKTYRADAVTLTTLHGSKGLEFPAVILFGADKGMIPLESQKEPASAEEERRLFYVGMTRARDELILLCAGEPSPFIGDIPGETLSQEAAQRTPAQFHQMELFDFLLQFSPAEP